MKVNRNAKYLYGNSRNMSMISEFRKTSLCMALLGLSLEVRM